jgi:hypothetical protein
MVWGRDLRSNSTLRAPVLSPAWPSRSARDPGQDRPKAVFGQVAARLSGAPWRGARGVGRDECRTRVRAERLWGTATRRRGRPTRWGRCSTHDHAHPAPDASSADASLPAQGVHVRPCHHDPRSRPPPDGRARPLCGESPIRAGCPALDSDSLASRRAGRAILQDGAGKVARRLPRNPMVRRQRPGTYTQPSQDRR